jgi:hypothetical protein
MSAATKMEQIEQLNYLIDNLSGETPESRSLISQLEIAKEFVGFGGVWSPAPLEPLRDGEQRHFFASPAQIIKYYGTDEAQALLDTNKFVTQLLHDGRWVTTVVPKTTEDYATEQALDAERAK